MLCGGYLPRQARPSRSEYSPACMDYKLAETCPGHDQKVHCTWLGLLLTLWNLKHNLNYDITAKAKSAYMGRTGCEKDYCAVALDRQQS